MSGFPTTDMDRWGEGGTHGGPWASFLRRYQGPLAVYARRRLGVSAELAEELAARFVAREVGREHAGSRPVFRLYDPARGRFRSLLATSFWRFARDELRKEARHAGPSLDAPEGVAEPEADDEFARLVAREFFDVLRARIQAAIEDEEELAVFSLKWPVALDPLANAEIERRLNLTRARVRTLVGRVGERFVSELRALAGNAGLSPGELEPFLADACRVLDRR